MLTSHPRINLLLLSGLISSCFCATLNANEFKYDTRELCRMEVISLYLNYLSDITILSGSIHRQHQSIKELNSRRASVQKELQNLADQRRPGEDPSYAVDEKSIGLDYSLKTYDTEIADSESSRITFEKDLKTRQADVETFAEQIKAVFFVHKDITVPDGAYPIKIAYKHSCSTYHYLCPLPESQRESLLKIAPLLDDPTPCLRYAGIRLPK